MTNSILHQLFCYACDEADSGKLQALLEQYPYLINCEYEDNYLLSTAIMNKNKEAVTILLNTPHVNINQQDDRGNSALHYAMIVDTKMNFIVSLIKKNADINLNNNRGQTPFFHSLLKTQYVLIDLYLQYNLNLLKENPVGKTAFTLISEAQILSKIENHLFNYLIEKDDLYIQKIVDNINTHDAHNKNTQIFLERVVLHKKTSLIHPHNVQKINKL